MVRLASANARMNDLSCRSALLKKASRKYVQMPAVLAAEGAAITPGGLPSCGTKLSVCFGCEPDAQVLKDRLAKREAMVRTPIGGSSVPELLCTFSKGLD